MYIYEKAIRILLALSLMLSLSSTIVGCDSDSSSTTQNTASQSGTKTDTSEQDVSGETTPEQNSQSKEPEYTLGNIVSRGLCGDSVTYELDENGLLVISGSGDMDKYGGIVSCPWAEQREDIKTVIIKKGVTSIGEFAFASCTNLTAITIPDSVTSIGIDAFSECISMTAITIPDSVTSIGEAAFYLCHFLTISGKSGSYAETYAKNYRIPFSAV